MLDGRIFVTGGAGFLARALYMRAAQEKWMAEFTAFSRDDAKHAALLRRFPAVHVIRGDVAQDYQHLRAAMEGHDVVLHMAAAKYVDLSELNAFATTQTNVIGSMNVLRAAIEARVSVVVAISTDKAAAPVNTYGATKFIMERLVQDFHAMGGTRIIGVRYGNVIGSTGSAIPLFRKQYEQTGKVLVTDPEMTRFWMSADQAIDVILTAIEASGPGTITIPGRKKIKAMKLLDVVHAAIGSVEPVQIVGPRPGEKRHEQLITEPESLRIVPAGDYHILLAPVASRPGEPWEFRSDTAELMRAADLVDELNKAASI